MMSGWPNGALQRAVIDRPRGRRRPRLLALQVATACAGALLLAPAIALAADPLYGIVPGGELPPAEEMELMHAGGVESIRLTAHWGTVEFVPGARDWSSLDSLVLETTRTGSSRWWSYRGSPDWVARWTVPVRARLLDHRAGLASDPPGVRAVRPRRRRPLRAGWLLGAAGLEPQPAGRPWVRSPSRCGSGGSGTTNTVHGPKVVASAATRSWSRPRGPAPRRRRPPTPR